MRLLFLIFFLIPCICSGDSELTIGGRTASAHLIKVSGVDMPPRPYLEITGDSVVGTDSSGITTITIPQGLPLVGPTILTANVGIGSASPGKTLDVTGTVRATTFIGDGSQLTGISSPWSRTAPNVYPTTITDNVGIGTSTTVDILTVANGVTINGYAANGFGIDSNVNFALSMAGTNGSTTFTDLSSNGLTFTSFNDGGAFPAVNSTYTLFGNNATAATQGGNIRTPANAVLAYGSGDFTIDFDMQGGLGGSCGATTNQYWVDMRPAATDGAYPSIYTHGCQIRYKENGVDQITGSTLTQNTWYHIAYVRHSGTGNLYVNGISVGSWSDSVTYLQGGVTLFAAQQGNVNDNGGVMANVRGSNIARWTANFTPPNITYGSSSSTPTLTFANGGSTISKIQGSSVAQTLSIINNGITSQTIDSNGNVGVGSTAPGQVLDVAGNIRANGTNSFIAGSDNSVSIASSAASSGAMTLSTNSLERMRIDNSGNIGIGTTNTAFGGISVMNGNIGIGTWKPVQMLDMGRKDNGLVVIRENNLTDGTSAGVRNTFGAANAGVFAFAYAPSATIIPEFADKAGLYTFNDGTGGGQLVLAAALAGKGIDFYSGGTAASNKYMVLDPNGNVGIGTSLPSQLLEVGNRKFDVLSGGNVGIGTWVPNQSLEVYGAVPLRLSRAASGSYDFTITGGQVQGDTNDLAFDPVAASSGFIFRPRNSGGSQLKALEIKADANVGIGTTNPSGLLEVGNQKFNVLSGGNVGVGSITPGQLLDVQGTVRIIGAAGRLVSSQVTSPTVANNDCGTTVQGTIVANSSDLSGTVTVGTLTVTSCAVTFNGTFNAAANCICQDDSNVLAVRCTASTTKLTITSLTSMSSDNVTWWCPGNS